MFAHQVIKDIGRMIGLLFHGPEDSFEEWQARQKFKDTLNEVIPLIIKSKKYHFGNISEDVVKIIEPSMEAYRKVHKKNALIFQTFSDYLIFPYELLWFDWVIPAKCSNNLVKMGTLIQYTNVLDGSAGIGHGDMYVAYLFSHEGNWIMYPDTLLITGNTKEGYRTGTGTIVSETILNNKYRNTADEIHSFFQKHIYAILLFLNCRNVKVCKQRPATALVKKRQKRNKIPLFTYHVLEIEDMRKRSTKSGGGSRVSKGIQRYHEMPARVAYYTKEKPLFGNPKLHGLFAFKSHWKGNPEKGIILRDYKTKQKEV